MTYMVYAPKLMAPKILLLPTTVIQGDSLTVFTTIFSFKHEFFQVLIFSLFRSAKNVFNFSSEKTFFTINYETDNFIEKVDLSKLKFDISIDFNMYNCTIFIVKYLCVLRIIGP